MCSLLTCFTAFSPSLLSMPVIVYLGQSLLVTPCSPSPLPSFVLFIYSSAFKLSLRFCLASDQPCCCLSSVSHFLSGAHTLLFTCFICSIWTQHPFLSSLFHPLAFSFSFVALHFFFYAVAFKTNSPERLNFRAVRWCMVSFLTCVT